MQKIRIDFDNPGLPQHISAVENDSQSRFFQATLYENGKAYTAPEGATYSIMYRGFGPQNQGWYDTINDGAGKRAACAVSGNVVTCEIARQALQVPGHVSIVLCVTTGKGYMLKSWPIECDCKNDRYDSTAEIQSFFYITQVSNADWTQAIQAWENLKDAIDPTLSVSGKAADAAKVGTSLAEETTRAKAAEEENAKGVSQLKEDLVDILNLEPINIIHEMEYGTIVLSNGIKYDGSINAYRSKEFHKVNDKLLFTTKNNDFGVGIVYYDANYNYVSYHDFTPGNSFISYKDSAAYFKVVFSKLDSTRISETDLVNFESKLYYYLYTDYPIYKDTNCIFPLSSVIDNGYYDYTSGSFIKNEFLCSAEIKYYKNCEYYINSGCNMTFWNSDKNFISGVDITIARNISNFPENTKYIRFSVLRKSLYEKTFRFICTYGKTTNIIKDIGDLDNLKTERKENLVASVNELSDSINNYKSENIISEEAILSSIRNTVKLKRPYWILHLDCGRKYFSVANIKKMIDSMSKNGLNQLQLHFSEDTGFRFKLDDMNVITLRGNKYDISSCVSTDKGGYLSEFDMDSIISYASSKKIQVVPSLDMPGHMSKILTQFSRFRYRSEYAWTLNVKDKLAVEFAFAIIDKYASYFKSRGCEFWNIGADEVGFSDAGYGRWKFLNEDDIPDFINFINKAALCVSKHGLVPRIFNDSLFYNNSYKNYINKNIEIYSWTNGKIMGENIADIDTLVRNGYSLINTNISYYYIVPNSNNNTSLPLLEKNDILKNFANGTTTKDQDGTCFCVWCDSDKSSDGGDAALPSILGALDSFGKGISLCINNLDYPIIN